MLEDEFQDTASSDTNKYNLRIVSHLNVFFKCRGTSSVQWGGWGGCNYLRIEYNMKLKFSMLTYLTHINTVLEYYHASVIIDL